MKQIPLTGGGHALVDDADYPVINTFKWYLRTDGYAATKQIVPDVTVLMHRLLINTPKPYHTDHINGNKLDNRRENLRVATAMMNQANSRKHKKKSSIYKGVTFRPQSGRWIAQIAPARKNIRIGTFDTEHQAAVAYDFWATFFWGEFAYTNFQPIKKPLPSERQEWNVETLTDLHRRGVSDHAHSSLPLVENQSLS